MCSKRERITNRSNTEDRERCMPSTRRSPKVDPIKPKDYRFEHIDRGAGLERVTKAREEMAH